MILFRLKGGSFKTNVKDFTLKEYGLISKSDLKAIKKHNIRIIL